MTRGFEKRCIDPYPDEINALIDELIPVLGEEAAYIPEKIGEALVKGRAESKSFVAVARGERVCIEPRQR